MSHLGDIPVGEEVNFKFTTVNTSGVPTALAGSPVISIYKDNNLTQSTAGVTLTTSFDGVTGLNHVNITTISDASFYIDRASYSAVITTGTVDGSSVVGYVVAQWKHRQSIGEQVWGYSVGAIGTVSDSFGGALAEIWNRVGSLLDAAISSRASSTQATNIQSDTDDIQSRLPAALVSGRMDSSTGAMAADVLTSTALAASAVTEIQTGLATSTQATNIQADTDDIQSRLPAGLVNGRIAAQVEDVSPGAIGFTSFRQTFWDGITQYVWGASVGAYGTLSDSFASALNEVWTRVVQLLDAPSSTLATSSQATAILNAVSNIAVTSAALNATAASRTITTGTESGSVSNTTQDDGTYHDVSDSAGTLDFYYEFDVSAVTNAVGTSCQWKGYVTGVANSVKVYARNFGGASWEQIGTINGISGAVDETDDFELTSAHTSAGLVRIRFSNTGLVAATVKTDRILLGYAITPSTLDASGVRSAVGLASANLDTQLSGIQSDTNDIQTRLPAGLVGGRLPVHVEAISDGLLTFPKFSQNYWDGVTQYVWGASVGAYGSLSDSFGGAVAETWDRSHRAADVWDVQLSAHLQAGSTGFALNAAGAAGDLWSTSLPGAYGAGTAGFIVGTNLDAQVSSRLASASYTAPDNATVSSISARLPAGLINGRMASHVEAISDGALTLPKFSQTYFDAITAYVWGASVGQFGSLSDAFGGALAEVWDKAHRAGDVWDVALAQHLAAGSTGFALNAAGSAGDPWGTALPGAYGVGTAGFIVGTNLNATVSSRLASASYTAPPTALEVADQVWDEAIAGHLSAGSTGATLNGAGGGSTPDQVAAAVWGYSVGLAGVVSDSFGQAVAEVWNRVDVQVSSRSNHAAADVWTVSARLLTAGTNIVLAKGVGVTGFNDVSSADVTAAVPTAVQNADALLARNIAGGSDGGRDVTSALRILRNRFLSSAGTLTVYREDDVTPAWTSSLATDAAALPIVGSDPA